MFKDFASYLTTLKQRLEEYFARAEQEENEKIASFFSSLKKSLLGKQEAVAAWENEITIGEKKYDREKERLEVLLGDLQKILTEGLPIILNLPNRRPAERRATRPYTKEKA